MCLYRLTLALVVGVLLMGGVGSAVAQPVDPTNTVTFDWKTVAATFVNTTLVLALVMGINAFKPIIRVKYPWAIPLMATVLGPVIGAVQTWVMTQFGIQVDFSPVLAALAGAAATTAHQVGKGVQEVRHN
jgi:hypothetical protein